jgi:cell division septal protein FtsQ
VTQVRRTERRRRRRASPVRRLQPFWFLSVVVLGLLSVGIGFLASWNALYPHRVSVLGNHVVSKDAILERARVDYAKNMWLQRTGPMVARIESIPYIDKAWIHRRLPDIMTVTVTERAPYAFVDAAGGRLTVDHDLRVLQLGAPDTLSRLPAFRIGSEQIPAPGAFINDAGLQSLRTVTDAMLAAHLDPASLELDRFGDATAMLHNGIRVLLGDQQGMNEKIALIEPILAQVERGKRPVVAIDLRAITTPVVVYGK